MMAESEIALLAADVDGTIHDGNGIPDTVHRGLRSLQESGLRTTVNTSRSQRLLKRRIPQDHLGQFVTPTTPMSLENGGRVADVDGKEYGYYPLRTDEIEALPDFLSCLSFIGYFPWEHGDGKADIWVCDHIPHNLAEKLRSFSHMQNAHDEMWYEIEQKNPCLVVVHPRDPAESEDVCAELQRLGLNALPHNGDIYISPQGVDKGTGLCDIAAILGIEPHEVLAAGDGWNDVPAFLQAGMSIVVSDIVPDDALQEIVFKRVRDPEGFGEFLLEKQWSD